MVQHIDIHSSDIIPLNICITNLQLEKIIILNKIRNILIFKICCAMKKIRNLSEQRSIYWIYNVCAFRLKSVRFGIGFWHLKKYFWQNFCESVSSSEKIIYRITRLLGYDFDKSYFLLLQLLLKTLQQRVKVTHC